MSWFSERREKQLVDELVPTVMDRIRMNIEKARRYRVLISDAETFEILQRSLLMLLGSEIGLACVANGSRSDTHVLMQLPQPCFAVRTFSL